MSAEEDEGRRRTQGRSPPFPFIALAKAVEQARKLDRHSRGHPVRAAAAGSAWGYKPDSSSSLQTVAALKAFGLISASGSREERRVQLTDLAKGLLRNPPADVERRMLQEAALQPRLIKELWATWGMPRPHDEECRWTLVQERGFTDDAAQRFLAVYDETITYAGLSESDTLLPRVDDTAGDIIADPEPLCEPERRVTPLPTPAVVGREVALMDGERVVFTEEVEPGRHLRVVVSGEVDEELLEGLSAYLELQKKRLERKKQRETAAASASPMAAPEPLSAT